MSQENITIKLPKSTASDNTAVIRGFVKNKDRKAVRRASLIGTEIDPSEMKGEEVTIKLKAENMAGVTDTQVKCLLISYEGVTSNPFEAMMDSEFEEDMDAVEKAVRELFDNGGNSEDSAKK